MMKIIFLSAVALFYFGITAQQQSNYETILDFGRAWAKVGSAKPEVGIEPGMNAKRPISDFRSRPPSSVRDSLRSLPTSDFRLPISGLTAGLDHDFHVSKCLVEYNEGEQALQMSLHLFIDDLEEALRRQGADKLFICTKKEDEQAEQHIYRYLQAHFQFEVNGKAQKYTFIGKEVSEDLSAVWCYLEIAGVSSLQDLKVENSILLDVFDDQKNLVSISGPGKKQGLLLFQKGDTVKKARF